MPKLVSALGIFQEWVSGCVIVTIILAEVSLLLRANWGKGEGVVMYPSLHHMNCYCLLSV